MNNHKPEINFWVALRQRREQDQQLKFQREQELLAMVAWARIQGKKVEEMTPKDVIDALNN
jgi:hypothetical protein